MKRIITIAVISRIILVAAIICFTIVIHAQNVAINGSGANADNSAMLDVSSTSKGFLAPRMSTIQRTGITTPANGLLVFDTDTKTYWYHSDVWKEITNAGGGAFSLPYSGSSNDLNKVFSIANINNLAGSAAIFGKSGFNPSGITVNSSAGIWGDNYNGHGVIGTSHFANGVTGNATFGHGIYGTSASGAYAGVFGTSSEANGVGVKGEMHNGGNAVVGQNHSSAGRAGSFEIYNDSNSSNALYALTYGTGNALAVATSNSNNTAPSLLISTNGKNSGLGIQTSNPLSNKYALYITNVANYDAFHILNSNLNGNAFLFSGVNNGLGGGIDLNLNNANSTAPGINIINDGVGVGISARSEKGIAAAFTNNNIANLSTVIDGLNNGGGHVAHFRIFNLNNSVAVLQATTNGTGPGIDVNNTNANVVNSLALFRKNGVNKARIDGAGKGFFNGGTQVGGADMAEVFDVEDDIQNYETGDVLVISLEKDRSVVKSSQSYSTLVVGVYATKPGVLMTEEDIETDLSGKVPMGVLGVIPTKVCLEGGEIRRGDLLVTSSLPGVAMKADMSKVKPGQVIGKALENFNETATGKIRVLVNVR